MKKLRPLPGLSRSETPSVPCVGIAGLCATAIFLCVTMAAHASPRQDALAPAGAAHILRLWNLTLIVCGIVFATMLTGILVAIAPTPRHRPIARAEECLDRLGGSPSAIKDLTARIGAFGQAIGGMTTTDEVVNGAMSGYVCA